VSAGNYFPLDYFTARDAFYALSRNGDLFSHTIQATGPGGETLTIDGVYWGPDTPERLVLLTSGVHGVEGYAGCALQQLWLREFAPSAPATTGFLLVHAMNPYGFAHGRRVNEHNVDLNRNALNTFPGPSNPDYRALQDWLNPQTPARALDDFWWQGLPGLWRYGRRKLAQAVAGGQYEFPEGLFYGGSAQQESLGVLSRLLTQARFRNAREVWHIDLHSGLGAFGQYQFLVEEPSASETFNDFARRFGASRVMSNHNTNAAHYNARGIVTELTHRVFASARVRTATLEFGTIGPLPLLQVLRAENRLFHHGAGNAELAAHLQRRLRNACAPDKRVWREAVLAGGREIFTRMQQL